MAAHLSSSKSIAYRRDPEHVVSAGIEAVHEDDLVLGLLPGHAGLVVGQVPAVLELDPRRRHRRPAGRAGDLGRRGLQLPVRQRQQQHEREAREPPGDAACTETQVSIDPVKLTPWN